MRSYKKQGTLSNLINLIKFNWQKYSIFILIVLFLIFKIISLFKFHHPIWDEAVYLTMGKYIYSLGQSGFFEILRAPFFPLIIGIFWKLGLDYILWAEIVEILIGVGTIYLTYLIAKKEFNENVAILSAFFLALTPIFFLYTSYILVDIPALFFVLISFYFIQKEKYYLSGLFAGFAFLTRFPQALFVFAVGFFIIHRMIYEKKFKIHFINALKFGLIFLLLISSFFLFNYFFYKNETSEWQHAAFRPLIFSINNIYDSGKVSEPFYYYIQNLSIHNPFIVLSLLGLFFYFRKKIFIKKPFLFYSLLVFLIYYSLTGHKELRYALSFLPFIIIFSSFGLFKLFDLFKKLSSNKIKKIIHLVFSLILIVLIISLLAVIIKENSYRKYAKPEIVTNYYEYFKERPLEGAIITTDPLIGYYVDNRVYHGYDSLALFKELIKNVEYSAVFFDVEEFGCGDNELCNDEVKGFVNILLDDYLLVDLIYYERHKYIFTTKDYFDQIPKENVYSRFDLTENVLLSKFPNDTLIVSVILEDFPSLNDDKTNIWHKNQFLELYNFFNDKNLPVNLALIPTHLNKLNEINESDITLLKNSSFSFIQNGYSHSDELTKSYDQQKEKLIEGQKIIRDLLDVDVTAFIPPYYSSNTHTPLILEELGFKIYISNLGDTTVSSLNRFDQKLTPIVNWAGKEYLSEELLKRNLIQSEKFEPYLVYSLYYFMFDENNIHFLDLIYNLTKNYIWMDIYTLNDWVNLIDNVVVSIEGDEINIILNDDLENINELLSSNLTLLFYGSGNYTINHFHNSINIKNVVDENIRVCISNNCKLIKSNDVVKFEI
jgi:4-amino-4-deoxy-L-arabinose transferase-like glycosyltransferase